jgi:hypothetical protein
LLQVYVDTEEKFSCINPCSSTCLGNLQGGTVLIAGGLTLRNGVESITLLQLVAGKAWQSRSEDR